MSSAFSPIRWTESQKARLRRAVSAYNRAITIAQQRYPEILLDRLPEKTSVQSEMANIKTARQLNYRVASLGRVLKKNAKDGQDPLRFREDFGKTEYEYREGVIAKGIVNRDRLQLARDMGLHVKKVYDRKQKKWLWMPADAETRIQMDERNIWPLQADVSIDNVDRIRRQAFDTVGGNIESTRLMYETYLEQWERIYYWCDGYQEVVDILNELLAARPEVLRRVFEDYDYYGTFTYMYPKYDRSPIERKCMNSVRYWGGVRDKYLRKEDRKR